MEDNFWYRKTFKVYSNDLKQMIFNHARTLDLMVNKTVYGETLQ